MVELMERDANMRFAELEIWRGKHKGARVHAAETDRGVLVVFLYGIRQEVRNYKTMSDM